MIVGNPNENINVFIFLDSQTDSTDVIRSTTATVSTPESVFNDYESSNAAGKKYVSAAARFIAGATIPLARSIQEELTELAAQLHPIDSVAVALAIEACSEDIVPCACRLIEVEEQSIVEATIAPDESNKPALQESIEPVTAKPKAPDPIESRPPVVPTPKTPPPQVLPPATEPERIVVAPKKLVKSIFDLDYDEDEDPIHKFAVVVQATPAPQPDVKPIENANKKTVIDQPVEVVAVVEPVPPPLSEPTAPQIPRFRVVEDPKCLAAKYYVTQKQDVCEEHLEALHNMYIPNVNGNWDHGSSALDIEPDADADGNEIEPDLYERIVPTYNHMCADRIPKNLRHITFSPEQRDYKRRAFKPPEVLAVPTAANLRLYDGLDQHKTEDEICAAPNGDVPLNVIDPYVLDDQDVADYDAGYDDAYGMNVVNEPDIGDPTLDDTDLDDYDVPIAAYEPMSMDFEIPAVDLFPSAPTQPSLWLEPVTSVQTFLPLPNSPQPPAPSSRRSSSKVKYKIRKCSTDLTQDGSDAPQTTAENSCATVPGGSTKIIIKLSRQLTNCSEEDEDDDEDDEDDDEEENDYDDEEMEEELDEEHDEEIDEDNECEEDDDELIAVPDETLLVPVADTNDLRLGDDKTIAAPQCDDVANNNDDPMADTKPFIEALEIEHKEIEAIAEEIVTTTPEDAIEVYVPDEYIIDTIEHQSPRSDVEHPGSEHAVSEQPVSEYPESEHPVTEHPERVPYERLIATNYGQMPSFDNLTDENRIGRTADGVRFREWHEVVRVRSYNDELLTILPYVVID